MNRWAATAIVALVGVLAMMVACGGDDGTGANPPGAGVDSGASEEGGTTTTPAATTGVEQLAEAYCRFAERCREHLFRASWEKVDDCIVAYRIDLGATVARPGAAPVDAQMAACAAKVKAATCDVALNRTLECLYHGESAVGSGCREPAQCLTGSCTQANAGSACGLCTDSVGLGGDCTKGDCKPSLVAKRSADLKTCTCMTPAAEGESCSVQPCGGRLVCSGGVCKKYLQLGEPCVAGAGDLCDYDRDYHCSAGTCAQRTRVKLGQPCDSVTSCEASTCVNGKCVAYAGPGSVCGVSGVPYCSFELSCEQDGVDGGAHCVTADPKACVN